MTSTSLRAVSSQNSTAHGAVLSREDMILILSDQPKKDGSDFNRSCRQSLASSLAAYSRAVLMYLGYYSNPAPKYFPPPAAAQSCHTARRTTSSSNSNFKDRYFKTNGASAICTHVKSKFLAGRNSVSNVRITFFWSASSASSLATEFRAIRDFLTEGIWQWSSGLRVR